MDFLAHNPHLLITFAQAYGSGTYNCGVFQGDGVCQTGEPSGPLAPITGFLHEQPSFVVIPIILVALVMLAALGALIGVLIQKARNKQ